MNILFVGHTLGAGRTVGAAPVPANYKDPAKIAERQAQNAEAAARLAPTIPTAGYVASYCLLDSSGDVVGQSGGPPPFAARDLMLDILGLYPKDFGALPAAGDAPLGTASDGEPFYLVGFGVKTLMRVACLEVLKSNLADEYDCLHVPPGLYRGEQGLHDPYEVLIHSAHQTYVDLPSLLQFFDLPAEGLADPATQAQLARKLAIKAQLFRPAFATSA